jgi:Na+/proline symporter
LFSRALATGISIYGPAIILSSVMGWNIYVTNVIMGGIVILYSISGGARAVAYTQQLQLGIIFAGLILAAILVVNMMPDGVGLVEAVSLGKEMGKMNVITTGITEKGFDWNDRFNIFSGVIGGFFLALSYFGTDQSQVGRYLTASSIRESRIGLIMNGIVKIPMQYFILLIGVLVFVFYMFNTSPIFFNQMAVDKLKATAYKSEVEKIEADHAKLSERKKVLLLQWQNGDKKQLTLELKKISDQEQSNRKKMTTLVKSSGIAIEQSDTNYIFIRFVTDHLPKGLVGLLIAVIFLAAWGSISATLNSLSSSTLIDFHKIHINKNPSSTEEFSL